MAKTLIYDIETSPLISYTWGTYQTNVVQVIQEWYIMCFAYKWLDEKKVHVVAQPDFPQYKKKPRDDLYVVKELYKLFEQADIIVAHNGDRFDKRKTNARFIYHGMTPPTFYQTVDTLKVARREFAFTSNKLDDLGNYLKVGRKVEHTGFQMWVECMDGNKKAWDLMKKYNKQDVILLQDVYLKLLPWTRNHPNLAVLDNRPNICPNCGDDKLWSKGYKTTRTSRYKQWQCQSCGAYSSDRKKQQLDLPERV